MRFRYEFLSFMCHNTKRKRKKKQKTSASSEALVLLRTRRVAAVPTTVAAIATETAVSTIAGMAVDEDDDLLLGL